jgi:CubicO group peptidase (beta-lactamase class C family)
MQNKIKRSLLVLILINSVIQAANSQALPDSMISKIDGLFKKWDNPNTPGCVVGIVRNDSLIYSKGYGQANLENNTPNTPPSIYYMASVSKQFTAYAITLLARQGKLKIDDDIHQYLPWMADFGKKITIRNLLNHTSGIRDDINLKDVLGMGPDGMLTQALALKILKGQRTLNFSPGEMFSYSNSNYVLLAEILKVASGQSFRAFTNDAIFKPLGMTNTRFIDDNREVVRDRVPSYNKTGPNTFKNNYQNIYTLGDGGLFTNVTDMAHWIMNFYDPKAGDANDIVQLTEKGKLNSGKEINYARGINVDSAMGWKRFSHNGGLAAYNTIVAIYPDLKTGFIVFGNGGDNEIYSKPAQLAALLIRDTQKKKASAAKRDSATAQLKDPDSFKQFEGNYISDNGYRTKFSIAKGKLWVNKDNLLINESGNTFVLFADPTATKYIFSNNKTGVTAELQSRYLDRPSHLVKYSNDATLSDKFLQTYTGTYYSPELDCTYYIRLKDHYLYFVNNLHADALITMLGPDHLSGNNSPLDHVSVIRKKGKIVGFELNSGTIMHLRFNKTAE